ncbi:phosphate propanoyltransferase [Paenibacillus alginolyticus]|uniref:Phosphate propanoyltransferase n=1 Tax=Paenibacillus alginolyticus TaxID=59839 RepID=A0ABT4GND5_9BACL|nr:phosphate propanoyltransferase [Paenibacillus alginolyticus]MCY9697645.1 phosphate propanoyltransferase [Paenibacillus alginolyticus]MEC0148357.1 phosphate propanoyltransferase [Paenibacillus alginolyticus]
MALITEAYLRTQLIKGLPNPFPIKEGDKLTPAAADFLKDRGIPLRRVAPSESTILPRSEDMGLKLIPVGVSNRHVHLSPGHVEALFGVGYALTPQRELSQKGQFAARETVTLVGPKGILQHVRILGPSRGATQVEISRTDGYALGVHPPVRLSGDIQGTPSITLVGASGTIVLQQGLIIAKNHVHMSPEDAQTFQVNEGDRIIVQAMGERPIIFADTIVRVSTHFSLDFHIDIDEANAAHLNTGDKVQVIGKNGEITRAERRQL